MPTVLLNCYTSEGGQSSVVPAEVAGGHIATEYLLNAGHRRIGYINGEPWQDASKDRLKGYRTALATADLPFAPELVRDGDWSSGLGFEQTLSLMREPNPPTAIFCANDLTALGAIEAIKQLGLRVPEDVSVLGYDDQEIARHTHPAAVHRRAAELRTGPLGGRNAAAGRTQPRRRRAGAASHGEARRSARRTRLSEGNYRGKTAHN